MGDGEVDVCVDCCARVLWCYQFDGTMQPVDAQKIKIVMLRDTDPGMAPKVEDIAEGHTLHVCRGNSE